jgi:ribosome-binding protein aMBF1 (putative translation factor)
LSIVALAALHVLKRLNVIPSPRKSPLTPRERDIIMRARCAAGKSQADLAREFGIPYQRIHQAAYGKRK